MEGWPMANLFKPVAICKKRCSREKLIIGHPTPWFTLVC